MESVLNHDVYKKISRHVMPDVLEERVCVCVWLHGPEAGFFVVPTVETFWSQPKLPTHSTIFWPC